ncbi:unnamed protein product [Trifolium pratense]|uniref:Uncharacterized protein n=1 Tax=Trifolium pratense TaxID=57577 RepID=A0ACB0M801_TRIPR|nr:unnamed protein product [Trifolium pratense]
MGSLEAPINNDEVKHAVFSMSPWKAPGPDGFPAGFYQKSWDIVSSSVCDFVRQIWTTPSEIGRVNKTDICLIPKVDYPEVVTQFRPISLCNTIYKIVSKVLVERLKVCIPMLISPFQTGFVPGRNIHENIVVAKEMIHSMQRMQSAKGAFAIKVDLSKAYDKLSWEFIWRILCEVKLPEQMTNVIMHAVTSVDTNVKWNGARGDFFKPQRGIRQGDPISPYLFVLCMDKLSHFIMHAVNEGDWRGIKAGRTGPMVSHLMFADDLLLFGEATEKQMKCVIDILQRFCMISGQEVSHEKTSVLFSKNVRRGMRDKLLHMSGFKETTDFGKYLGVPLIGRAPKRADYQYLIDQVSNKLSAWKARQLSFAGRVTLAKSVLEAVPIYPMMTSKIPKSCLNDIQRIQRNFIWGEYDNVRKYHAVKWSDLTKPKSMGGLGIRNLEIMNQACLLKLGWKIKNDSSDFWCDVLRGKYGMASFDNDEAAKPSSSSTWKTLVQLKHHLSHNMFWQVGDGYNIHAWNQEWIEPGLCVRNLCIIPNHMQDICVRDLLDESGTWNWNLLVEWMPSNIMNKIAAIPIPNDANGRDTNAGFGGSSSVFSVSAMYEQLCNFDSQNCDTLWQSVWKLHVAERVRCFVWLLLHDRLLTNYRKSRMGIGHAMCRYCGNIEETSLHALRDCALVVPFWLQVVPAKDRGSFFMEEIQQWIHTNMRKCGKRSNGRAWCDFWATACHSLWMWRNKEIHDEHFVRPVHSVQQVTKRVEEYYQASKVNGILGCREGMLVQIGWQPPNGSFVKLNTDGARKNNGRAGCGGVIRGSQGEWLGGFAKGVGSCSAFVAELLGVYEGLSYARRMGFMFIELNIDSAMVVQVINTGRLKSPFGLTLVKNIRRLVDMEWEVHITHAYRESNQCADALANIGCSIDKETIYYETCPSQIRELFLADIMGIKTPRVIYV